MVRGRLPRSSGGLVMDPPGLRGRCRFPLFTTHVSTYPWRWNDDTMPARDAARLGAALWPIGLIATSGVVAAARLGVAIQVSDQEDRRGDSASNCRRQDTVAHRPHLPSPRTRSWMKCGTIARAQVSRATALDGDFHDRAGPRPRPRPRPRAWGWTARAW